MKKPTLIQALAILQTEDEVLEFLSMILSHREITDIKKRWAAVCLHMEGKTQREVSRSLGTGIATASRTARVLRSKQSREFLEQIFEAYSRQPRSSKGRPRSVGSISY